MIEVKKWEGSSNLEERQKEKEYTKIYNRGRVDALIGVGYSMSRIAKILELNESSVRAIYERNEKID